MLKTTSIQPSRNLGWCGKTWTAVNELLDAQGTSLKAKNSKGTQSSDGGGALTLLWILPPEAWPDSHMNITEKSPPASIWVRGEELSEIFQSALVFWTRSALRRNLLTRTPRAGILLEPNRPPGREKSNFSHSSHSCPTWGREWDGLRSTCEVHSPDERPKDWSYSEHTECFLSLTPHNQRMKGLFIAVSFTLSIISGYQEKITNKSNGKNTVCRDRASIRTISESGMLELPDCDFFKKILELWSSQYH